MRYRVAAIAAIALLFGCSSSNGIPDLTPPPAPVAVQNDSDFDASGRYIVYSQAPLQASAQRSPRGAAQSSSAQKFYTKGMVYAPTPIGAYPFDSPLKDSNESIWSRDLSRMRAMGVNAIHVYNVTPPPYDSGTGPITKFLNAAWNGGNKPIYVIMSIYFTGDKLLDQGAVSALASQYHDLDKKYASYPAVMGVSISNEIGSLAYINNAAWWRAFNTIARSAKQGFADGGDAGKLVTTSEVDGSLIFVQKGEQQNAAVDAWGVNIYRGRTFTNLFQQIRSYTKKPVMLTEYGASAAYHPNTRSTYTYQTGPDGLGVCKQGSGSTSITDVAELPQSGNPNMAGLIDLVQNTTKLLYSGYQTDGVVSGGFYFEWTDEWWKANGGNPSVHYGNVAYNGHFPGCNEDQGWYGLNAVAPGTPNVLQPRPTLQALKSVWATQN